MQEQTSFTAAFPSPRCLVLAHWNLGNMLMQDLFFADKVDRGQNLGFSWLPLLWAINGDTEQEKRSIHPERNSTHLGIWAARSNKCIGLIIKDSLNEDGCYPLKALWFHKPYQNSDVVVITV